MSAARTTLAVSIESRRMARAALDDAEAAVNGARRFVTDLEAKVTGFEGIENKVARERAEAMKAALAAGQIPSFALSSSLATAVVAKAEAEGELTAARQALRDLDDDAARARSTVTSAEREVDAAIEAVLAEEAAAIFAELKRLEAELTTVQAMLVGATAQYRVSDGRSVEFNVGKPVFDVVGMAMANPEVGVRNSPAWRAAEEAKGRWRAFTAALEEDPSAVL